VETHKIRARYPVDAFERGSTRGCCLHRIAIVAQEDTHSLRLDRVILDYEDAAVGLHWTPIGLASKGAKPSFSYRFKRICYRQLYTTPRGRDSAPPAERRA